MKLLIDVSAGEAIAEALRTLGHDVLSVRDRDPRMADADILTWAVAEARLVVTMDKDFGEWSTMQGNCTTGFFYCDWKTLEPRKKKASSEKSSLATAINFRADFPYIRMAVFAFADCRTDRQLSRAMPRTLVAERGHIL